MKNLIMCSGAVVFASALVLLVGCWQSPVNSYVVLGFQREHVEFRGGDGTCGSATNPAAIYGHGNNGQAFVKQSNVGYKSPATSISNSLQGELSVPLTHQ